MNLALLPYSSEVSDNTPKVVKPSFQESEKTYAEQIQEESSELERISGEMLAKISNFTYDQTFFNFKVSDAKIKRDRVRIKLYGSGKTSDEVNKIAPKLGSYKSEDAEPINKDTIELFGKLSKFQRHLEPILEKRLSGLVLAPEAITSIDVPNLVKNIMNILDNLIKTEIQITFKVGIEHKPYYVRSLKGVSVDPNRFNWYYLQPAIKSLLNSFEQLVKMSPGIKKDDLLGQLKESAKQAGFERGDWKYSSYPKLLRILKEPKI